MCLSSDIFISNSPPSPPTVSTLNLISNIAAAKLQIEADRIDACSHGGFNYFFFLQRWYWMISNDLQIFSPCDVQWWRNPSLSRAESSWGWQPSLYKCVCSSQPGLIILFSFTESQHNIYQTWKTKWNTFSSCCHGLV